MPRLFFSDLLAEAMLDLEEMRELAAELPERDSQRFLPRIVELRGSVQGLLLRLRAVPACTTDH